MNWSVFCKIIFPDYEYIFNVKNEMKTLNLFSEVEGENSKCSSKVIFYCMVHLSPMSKVQISSCIAIVDSQIVKKWSKFMRSVQFTFLCLIWYFQKKFKNCIVILWTDRVHKNSDLSHTPGCLFTFSIALESEDVRTYNGPGARIFCFTGVK